LAGNGRLFVSDFIRSPGAFVNGNLSVSLKNRRLVTRGCGIRLIAADYNKVNWLIEARPEFQTLLRVGGDPKTLFLEAVNLTRPARRDLASALR